MKISIDKFELLDWMSGCSGGSHLRQYIWGRAIDEFYSKLNESEREAVYMCACACLNAAVTIWGMSVEMISNEYTLPQRALELDFKYFNLKDVAKLWEDALRAASPQCFNVVPDETDDKNINDGLKQIMEQWTEGKGIYDDMERTIRECGEDVLKTQGFVKKAIKEVRSIRDYHETL